MTIVGHHLLPCRDRYVVNHEMLSMGEGGDTTDARYTNPRTLRLSSDRTGSPCVGFWLTAFVLGTCMVHLRMYISRRESGTRGVCNTQLIDIHRSEDDLFMPGLAVEPTDHDTLLVRDSLTRVIG